MNFLDIRTLFGSYLVSILICVVVLAVLWRQNRERFTGIDGWLWALVLQPISLVLILLRGAIPDLLSIVLAGALAIFGAILMLEGLAKFIGATGARNRNLSLLAFFVAVHGYFTYVEPSLLVRSANYAIALFLVCGQSAWLMLRRTDAAQRSGTTMVGVVMLGYCLLNLARLVFVVVLPPGTDPFSAGLFDAIMFLAFQALVVALTFSLVLMVNDRLRRELELDNEGRKLSEAAALQSEARLVRAELASKAGNWELHLDSREIIGSVGATRVYGLDTDRLDYEAIKSIPLPEYREAMDRALAELIGRGVPYDLDFKIRAADSGEIRDIHSIASYDAATRTVFGIVQDVTERRKAEAELDRHRAHLEELVEERTRALAAANEQLRVSEERFDYALQATSDGIWDWRMDSGKTYINEAYLRMLGFEDGELAGDIDSRFVSLLHPDERESVMAEASKRLDDPGHYEIEFRMRCKDGSYKWVLSRGLVVRRDSDGRPIRAVGTHVDLTNRKLAEIQLREAKEMAESASRAKSTFLANMSHELRTPMNAIMGMTGLALRRAMDPTLRHQLETIADASDRLLGVINDVLDISKIEAEHMVLEEVDFHLREVFDNLISLIGQRLADKGLRLSLEPAAGVEVLPLRGDPLRVGQVLLNLAGNAVKFTERGTIRIRCRVFADAPEDTVVRFEVEDQGIGISVDDRKRLFSAFEQADGSMTRKYGGTGLGLVISKRLVELMGGEIGVESVVGVGSTFWFTVRVRKGRPGSLPAAVSAAGEFEGRLRSEHAGARILIAEDEPINREVSRMLLEDVGLVVDMAEDGAIAVELARRHGYAAILMDMQMPVLNGLDATRAIRALPGHALTPILAMTANAFNDDRQLCLAAGMNDHIAKPVNPDALYQILWKWLSSGHTAPPVA